MGITFLLFFSLFCQVCFGDWLYRACLYHNSIWTANNVQDQCRIWCPRANTCYEPCVEEISKDMVRTRKLQLNNLSPKKRTMELNHLCHYENTNWTAKLIYDHCRRWCPKLETCYEPCVKGLSDDLIGGIAKRSVLSGIKKERKDENCKKAMQLQ